MEKITKFGGNLSKNILSYDLLCTSRCMYSDVCMVEVRCTTFTRVVVPVELYMYEEHKTGYQEPFVIMSFVIYSL